MNRSAIMSESALRGRSTASTARSRSTLRISRLEMIYLDQRCSLGPVRQIRAAICVALKETLLPFRFFQAHDEICPKYPMICEGCAKKKIPREKVNLRPTCRKGCKKVVKLLCCKTDHRPCSCCTLSFSLIKCDGREYATELLKIMNVLCHVYLCLIKKKL